MSRPMWAMPRALGPMTTPPRMSRTVSGSIRRGTPQDSRGASRATATMHSSETKAWATRTPSGRVKFAGEPTGATTAR